MIARDLYALIFLGLTQLAFLRLRQPLVGLGSRDTLLFYCARFFARSAEKSHTERSASTMLPQAIMQHRDSE
jgi:hypothetical protein